MFEGKKSGFSISCMKIEMLKKGTMITTIRSKSSTSSAWIATKPLWSQPEGHIVFMVTYIYIDIYATKIMLHATTCYRNLSQDEKKTG